MSTEADVRRTVVWVVPLILALGVAGVRAQQASPPKGQTVFRGQVNLVQISVVATGPDGRPVRGLTKDDFTVIAGGSSRPIEGFVEIASPRPPASPFPATLAKDVSDNVSAKSDRVVILLLDETHLSEQTDEVKSLARRVVNGLGTGTSIGLITSSGDFGMEPTTDRAHVLEVIDDFVNKVERADQRRLPMNISSAWKTGGDLQREFDNLTMLKTNQDVAHMLIGQDTPRKAFIWLSRGVFERCPLTEEEDKWKFTLTSFDHRCKEMMYEMQRANVSTYAVDPGGGADKIFLSRISDATGGFAVRANDLDAGVDRILDDLNNYYLIGFVPADPQDTHYRHLEVRVNQPDVSLRYRTSYTAAAPSHVNTPKDLSPTAALVAGVLPKTDLRMRLSATALAPPAKDGTVPVAVAVEVHGDAAHLVASDGWLRDTLKFGIVAVDLRRKKPVTNRVEARSVSWRPESTSSGDVSYAVTTELGLPPGFYQLRASGESTAIGTSGSVYLVVTVPDPRAAPLALGGLLLGYASGTRIGTVASGNAETLPFPPTLDREFVTTDVLRLRCGVFRIKTVQDTSVTLDVIDVADHIVHSTVTHLAATDAPQFDTTLPLADFAPGAYRFRVTATAELSHDSREVGITVR